MTPQEINATLVNQIECVAEHLLPEGVRNGREWCVGSIHGEQGQSLRLCLEGPKKGIWKDFADGGRGGDLLNLWQQVRGISFVDVLREAKDFAGITDEHPRLYSPSIKKQSKPLQMPNCQKPSGDVLKWFEGRGIFQKSLDAYRVGQQGSKIIFPYTSPSGTLELLKYRDLNTEKSTGKKKIWSNADPEYHLWGFQAIDDNDRYIVICEGEIDALSWHQQGIPALSVPQGGGDGAKQAAWLENDYERLERFETIYISMDMDAPGQAAVQPIVSRLGVERCKVVDLGENKDANAAHLNGEVLQKYLDRAKTKDPEELRQLAEYHDEIIDEFRNADLIGLRLPWRKSFDSFRIRPSEITVWAGGNGSGKTVLLNHVVLDLVAQGQKICIASMEMRPRKLGRKMYQQLTHSNNPNDQQAADARLFMLGKVWLFEAFGTARAERIFEVFTYARKRYGINQFVVDSLSKCGFDEDDYNRQKHFVDGLMEFAGKNDVHVHLVHHVRKLSDESKVPGKYDVKGSSGITDMAHNVLVLWRNKPKEEAARSGNINPNEPDSVLTVVKQRETGEEPRYGLFYHPESCQFLNGPDDPPKQYI